MQLQPKRFSSFQAGSSSPVHHLHLTPSLCKRGSHQSCCESLGSPPGHLTAPPPEPGFHIKASSAPSRCTVMAALQFHLLSDDAIRPDTSWFGPPPPAPASTHTAILTRSGRTTNTRTHRFIFPPVVTPSRFQ